MISNTLRAVYGDFKRMSLEAGIKNLSLTIFSLVVFKLMSYYIVSDYIYAPLYIKTGGRFWWQN